MSSVARAGRPAGTAAPRRLGADGADTGNVLPPMRDALKPRATGGEVSHGPRDTWGVHVPLETF
ncbi:hypothetical protein OG780_05945 [Streptomyces sp. NBC_00386]|uniref:hypothetical protein n=1 Tax=Streptomyces sp. NBC_00386 TaxID=2975734 RepID=UPI002E1B6A6E